MGKNSKKSTPEKQALILWALLVRDGAAGFQKDLKPQPEKADRDALEEARLIRWEKREKQKIWIEVTEDGWAWAGKHLDAKLPSNSSAGSSILKAWLTRLKTFIETRDDIALADILRPKPTSAPTPTPAPAPTPAPNTDALRSRIRQAYLDLTGGRLNTRALLSDLREKLKDIDRATFDEALKNMQREEEASLYQLDNRAEITEADHAAAIYFGGEPRHILWIER